MISIIIPAQNAEVSIEECIRALQQQTIQNKIREIIVVDNGSTDQTAVIAERAGARVLSELRGGAAAARNTGIETATGDIICFTDADCCPTEDWVEKITYRLREDPEIIGAKGIYHTRQKEVVARFVQIEYEDKYDLLRPQKTIDFIDTYSAAYRRDILLANDGFDENIFFVEDQELSFRLAARGYKMVFQPDAAVYHLHSNTLWKYFRKKFFIGYWKAQVVRRFPTRGVKDSHTPQILKGQMVLIMALLASLTALFFLPLANILLPSPLWRLFYAVPVLTAFTYLISTVPFVSKAWPKDRAVAVSSPGLLAVRAAALSFGYAWGLLKPDALVSDEKVSTISGLNYILKRAIDLTGSLVGLVFTAILWPFIAVAIKLDSPGPIVFSQERIGQEGQPFTLYKFRSMHRHAEAELDRLVNVSELAEPAFKLDDDPRITRVGRFLRRWSLDELPQFWNVLKGDMSLIGPRPEESRIVSLYEDWHRRRLAVKPGLSGPMQINGRGDLPFNERIHLELDYIDHYSVWRDLKIIWRTVPTLFSGKGAR
ncbi:MAG: sugar transferase [Ardenticatenaceae bacterium]|nr:sugar transferase [Ardenticatenaceae bacterium]